MKVAICISGHVRNFEDCKSSFVSSIVEKYNPDIFVHTWSEYGYGRNGSPTNPINEETKLAIEKNKKYGLASNTEFLRETPKIDMSLFSGIDIKDIVVEDYNDVEPEILKLSEKIVNKWDIDYPPNFISSLRKIKLCNELVKNSGNEYDIVVRTRPDIFYGNVVFEENSDIFYTPLAQSYHAVSDIFFYSSPKIMDIFCSFYDSLRDYNDQGAHFNPHSLMMYHLNNKGIKYKKDPNLNLDILRR